MRILLIGCVEFSKQCFEKLISLDANIVGVITKQKSNFNSDFVDLSELCIKHNLPYKYVNDINHENNIAWIKKVKPDICFCFGWSSLIKKELLMLPPKGIVGFHPANLPQNRGRHPIIWALVLGLKETASTFFFMDQGADSGDILSQDKLEITFEDDALSLYHKITNLALKQIEHFLPALQNGTYVRVVQENKNVNYWRKRGKADGEINFKMHSSTIYNIVRALTKPYVGAHIEHNDECIKVWKVKPVKSELENIEFGKVIAINGKVFTVKTPDGAIEILDHQFDVLPELGTYL